MGDDRIDFEVVGHAARAPEVGWLNVTGGLSPDDCPGDIVGQPCCHGLDVALRPVGDELSDNGGSRRIAAVRGKDDFHMLNYPSFVVTGNATSHRGTDSWLSGV